MGIRRSFKSGLDPTSLGITGWLSNVAENGSITQWTDMLGTNHGTSNSARAPDGSVGGSLDFETNDCVNWPIVAGVNFNTSYLGFYFFCKPDATATTQTLISISIGSGGASARCMVVAFGTTTLNVDIYASGSAGRRASVTGMAAAGVSRLWGVEYNNDGATEDLKVTLTRDGTILSPTFANLGAGAAIGQLVSVTGDILIGNFADGTASNPLLGVMGRQIFAFTSPMAGATTGLLTTAARQALRTFYPLV